MRVRPLWFSALHKHLSGQYELDQTITPDLSTCDYGYTNAISQNWNS